MENVKFSYLFFSARITQIFLGCFNYASSCLFIERGTHAPFFILFFGGARWQVGDQLSATVARPKNKNGDLGAASFYKQATRNRVGKSLQAQQSRGNLNVSCDPSAARFSFEGEELD